MTECTELEMRDLLVDLLHGGIRSEKAAQVRSHLAGCGACRAEFEFLKRANEAVMADTPHLDVASIVAALPRPERASIGEIRPMSSARAGAPPGMSLKRRPSLRRRSSALALAAALAVAAIGLWRADFAEAPLRRAGGEVVGESGLTFAGGVSDLSDEALLALIDEINDLEPVPSAEPDPGYGILTGLGGD
jgi:anti-sigma factor RsiW